MFEKGKISSFEFYIFVIIFLIGTTVLNAPSVLTAVAKQDAWISTALTTLISFFFIFIYTKLLALYPSKTFVEMNEKAFGKWIGKAFALLYLFYVFHIGAASLRQVGAFFSTVVLVETPIEVIMIIFLITSLIGVWLGLEVIIRTAIIFAPWIILLLLMLFLLLIPEMKPENMQPIFEEGIRPIMNGLYVQLGFPFLQLVIFLMITPFINEKGKKLKKAFYSGTLVGGIIVTLLTLVTILILGVDLTARQAYPVYIIAKQIAIGDFLERIEVIVAIIWILTIYFKMTLCYYAVALGIAQVFQLKNYKILIYPLAYLMITFSIFMHPNVVHMGDYIVKTLPPFSLTICFLLPLLLLLVGKIRKKQASTKDRKWSINE